MGKNDRMIRAAPTLTHPPRLLIALLLSAAGLSAFGQAAPAADAAASTTPVAAPAPTASAAAPAPVARPRPPAMPSSAIAPLPSALAPAPTWGGLTPSQRQLLAPLQSDWAELSPSQRSKWVNATPMLATLPEADLARLHERMRGWARLSPAERRDARIAFQVAKQVDAEQRQAKWEAYQALPPEKRQELAEKAAARRKAQGTAKTGAKPIAAQPKSNVVPAAPKMITPVAVNGGLIQAKPGATTVLISRSSRQPPVHQVAGEAKVVADPSLVDAKTLLPKSLKAPTASEAGK